MACRAGLALFRAAVLLAGAEGRILSKCHVYNELLQHGFWKGEIPTWVCIVMGESTGNTAAINRVNSDGSVDYGLFQINNRYWCGEGRPGGGCNIPCSALIDHNIGDDIACARHIANVQGLGAWVAYRQKCAGRPLPDVSRC